MSDPVARIMSIKGRVANAFISPQSSRFTPGKFHTPAPFIAGGTEVGFRVPAVVARGHSVAVGQVNMSLQVGDFIRTDPDWLVLIEFFIGGRVGINGGTVIQVVDERSVQEEQTALESIVKTGKLWFSASAWKLKQPLEIQTNGGTMGIRG